MLGMCARISAVFTPSKTSKSASTSHSVLFVGSCTRSGAHEYSESSRKSKCKKCVGIEYHLVGVEDLRILEDELSTHRAVREVRRGDLGEARRRLGEGSMLKYRMIPG